MKHSLIDQWAAEHGLALDTVGGRRQVAVTVDTVRVHLRELSARQILVHARLLEVPQDPTGRFHALSRAMTLAAGRMRSSAAVLACDEHGDHLSLQLPVALPADVQALDRAVERLVNEVDLWREKL